MAGKYWFFSDADRLAMQSQADAFGPVTGSEATQFRVTDLHAAANASSPASAYAICDSLIRARLDNEGGLTLILKPTQQPPFDFPPIAFFLYKGLRPESLLKGGAAWPSVDPSMGTSIPLVERIVADWAANENTGDPSSKSLGLHLAPATAAAAGLDPTCYIDDEPLDNLFYLDNAAFPPRMVYAGEHLGLFDPLRFGLEIVIGRLGRPPRILYAARRETIITATPPPTGTLPADNAPAFTARTERDEILDFVDPCAFWGSFVLTGISACGTTLPDMSASGPDIYAQLLTGPAAQAPLFHNRHKAYLDIRNDHGHSLNYYRETDDTIATALGALGTLADTSYYDAHGWPCFAVPDAGLIAAAPAATDAAVPLKLALPAAVASRPVTYVSAGYLADGAALKQRKGAERFVTAQGPVQQNGLLPEISLAIPLAKPNAPPQLHAGYHRLHQFRRGGIVPGGTPPAGSPAPFFQSSTDHLFPIPGRADMPRQTTASGIRTFGELFFIPGEREGEGCVASPGIAYDAANIYFFLLPVALSEPQPDLVRPALPAWEETSETQFRPDLMLESGARLITRKVQPGGTDVVLFREQAPAAIPALSDNFWMIAMSNSELDAAIQLRDAGLAGTATLSLGSPLAGPAQYEQLAATISYLVPPIGNGTSVSRVHAASFQTVYRDAPA